jgi:hypothetical protein
LNQALDRLPVLRVTEEQSRVVLHGGSISSVGVGRLPVSIETVPVRLQDEEGRLLAIGIYDARMRGAIKVHKVLVDSESMN